MKAITFNRAFKTQTGQTYRAGETAKFPDAFADRQVNSGFAAYAKVQRNKLSTNKVMGADNQNASSYETKVA